MISKNEMQAKRFVTEKHEGEYLEYLYSEPCCEGKAPLVIYIHGAGSRGEDIDLLRENNGLINVFKKTKERAVVVAPQCHFNFWFTGFEILADFIDTMRQLPNVDADRVYVLGSSMGGYTTWQMILSHTEWFAAAVPICGGGMYWAASKLKNLPIWAFHGALDAVVLPEESIHMVKAINNAGGDAKITIFPKATHDAWTPALSDDATYEWLFLQKRKEE